MSADNIADQLVYATTKIKCFKSSVTSEGTGFFFQKELSNGKIVFALVTNNHVVDGFDNAEIYLASVNANGSPNDQNRVVVSISDLQKKRVSHPSRDIDICLLFVGDDINKACTEGKNVYYRSIPSTMIPSDEVLAKFSPIEDVIMVGYPNGLMDVYNNKPIVRKGITASSIKLDYDNRPEFLVDMACFWGSSGSPVFIRTESTGFTSREKGVVSLGKSINYYFGGVLHSGPVRKMNGEILVKDVPTALTPCAEFELPLNLGYIIKAKKIVELFDAFFKV